METINGRILKGLGGLYEIFTPEQRVECRAKGTFRYEKNAPTAGDLVTVTKDEKGNAIIAAILPRKNILIRPPLANLDTLFCVIPAKDPLPDLFTLDKLIAIAESLGIRPVVIITKADLDGDHAAHLSEIYASHFDVFLTSSIENRGIDLLKRYLTNQGKDDLSAFAGASGAGKSTLVNCLFPSLSLHTGQLSAKISRGRHTTRHVELFPLKELCETDGTGFLADTPGFSMLDFQRYDFFDKEELPYTFREFTDYLGHCRYTRCTHLCEEGCAIVEAVKDGKIAPSRHTSYTALFHILKNKKPWDKK